MLVRFRHILLVSAGAAVIAAAVLVLGALRSDDTRGSGPQSPSQARVGLNGGHLERRGGADAARVDASLVRHEFLIGTPIEAMREVIADYARHNIKVLLLAGFPGGMPTPEAARSLGTWASEFGPDGDFWRANPELDGSLAVTEIEFGNETSSTYQYGDDFDAPSYVQRATDYAHRFADAHAAVREANPDVGMLAQVEDGGSESMNWINAVKAAQPDLDEMAVGWVAHPYGPRWEEKIERLVDQTSEVGWSSSVPVWITEFGLSTDDGRCLTDNYGWDPCMTYEEAARTLREVTDGARDVLGRRLGGFFVYQTLDQRPSGTSSEREHYFGALKSDRSEKGPYTTEVRRLVTGA